MTEPSLITPTGRGRDVVELLAVAGRIAELDELVPVRDALILRLHRDGLNGAQLADLAGLTRQRVHQLITKATEEAPA